MSAYSVVGDRVRAHLRAGHGVKDLSALTRQLQRGCELLDLSAIGINTAVRNEKYGEAQIRADAAERFAEDLHAAAQALAIRIRDARIDRSSAA